MRSVRALIVDDSSFVREYLGVLLRSMGVVCQEAPDGAAALEILAAESPFDLMLLDLNMPVMDGMQCMKAVRDARVHPSMKILMVTTEAESAVIADALQTGADEFLMKPFTPEGLREKMMLLGIAA